MRSSWRVLPKQLPLYDRGRSELTAVEVVEEFNGPQIVFGDLIGERCLGVAADEEETFERWLFAPVSRVEEQALRSGVATLREALWKASARVVDFSRDGAQMRVIPIDGELLDAEELPEAGIRLEPALVSSPIEGEKLEFTVDRLGGIASGVSLTAAAALLQNLQRYADAVIAFAESGVAAVGGRLSDEVTAKSALTLQTALQGSLILEITSADWPLAQQVVTHLRQAADAGDSQSALEALADQGGVRALLRYEDLLATLQRHQLQLLARGGACSAFLSWTSAERFSGAMPDIVQRELEPIVVRGYFLDFGREKGEFVFVDVETEDLIQGAIDASVISEDAPITVHASQRYIVEIDRKLVTTRDKRTLKRHVLKRVLSGAGDG